MSAKVESWPETAEEERTETADTSDSKKSSKEQQRKKPISRALYAKSATKSRTKEPDSRVPDSCATGSVLETLKETSLDVIQRSTKLLEILQQHNVDGPTILSSLYNDKYFRIRTTM